MSETFFNDVDGICISDNYWMGLERPCVTWGIRGNVYFAVEVVAHSCDVAKLWYEIGTWRHEGSTFGSSRWSRPRAND